MVTLCVTSSPCSPTHCPRPEVSSCCLVRPAATCVCVSGCAGASSGSRRRWCAGGGVGGGGAEWFVVQISCGGCRGWRVSSARHTTADNTPRTAGQASCRAGRVYFLFVWVRSCEPRIVRMRPICVHVVCHTGNRTWVFRSTQPSTLCGTVKWVPAKRPWCSAAGE